MEAFKADIMKTKVTMDSYTKFGVKRPRDKILHFVGRYKL